MVNGRDIAEALAAALAVIPDVRTYAYGPDNFLPPGISVQQPTMNWESGSRTFCAIQWTYPLLVAVARNSEREAQASLYRLVEAISDVLAEDHDLGGLVQTARLTTASPATVTSNGQEYPGYSLTVEVIA
jgi:hypothetical protein